MDTLRGRRRILVGRGRRRKERAKTQESGPEERRERSVRRIEGRREKEGTPRGNQKG